MQLADQVWAEEEITGIGGASALGSYRLKLTLRLRVDLTPPRPTRLLLLDIYSELFVAGLDDVGRMGAKSFLGIMRPVNEPAVRQIQSRQDIALEIQLGQRQIDAVEAVRRGGHLRLDLQLRVATQLGEDVRSYGSELFYRANRGVWIETLEAMGYGRVLLLEIPVPDADLAPSMAGAVQYLSRAQQSLLNGDVPETITACRKALEALAQAMGQDQDDWASVKALGQNQQTRLGMDKATRVDAIRHAVQYLAGGAGHAPGASNRIVWNRHDAAFVLTLTASRLQLNAQTPMKAAPPPAARQGDGGNIAVAAAAFRIGSEPAPARVNGSRTSGCRKWSAGHRRVADGAYEAVEDALALSSGDRWRGPLAGHEGPLGAP